MFIGKCYLEPPTELWSKGLVFLNALRECLRWSLRTADPHTVLAYTQDGYAGLRIPGFCLRKVLIDSPLLQMNNWVLNVAQLVPASTGKNNIIHMLHGAS